MKADSCFTQNVLANMTTGICSAECCTVWRGKVDMRKAGLPSPIFSEDFGWQVCVLIWNRPTTNLYILLLVASKEIPLATDHAEWEQGWFSFHRTAIWNRNLPFSQCLFAVELNSSYNELDYLLAVENEQHFEQFCVCTVIAFNMVTRQVAAVDLQCAWTACPLGYYVQVMGFIKSTILELMYCCCFFASAQFGGIHQSQEFMLIYAQNLHDLTSTLVAVWKCKYLVIFGN